MLRSRWGRTSRKLRNCILISVNRILYSKWLSMPFRQMKICLQTHYFKARLSFDLVLRTRWLGDSELPAVGVTLLLLLLLLSNSWFDTPDLIIVCYNTPPILLEKTLIHVSKFWVWYFCSSGRLQVYICSIIAYWHNMSFRGSTIMCFEPSLVPYVGLFVIWYIICQFNKLYSSNEAACCLFQHCNQ